MQIRRPLTQKVGLALGGGAILGAAHIGVLQAFEESEIELQALSGTSIGALVAAMYAFGIKPAEIAERAANMDWLSISVFKFSRMGLLANEKLGELMREWLGDVNIEDSPIPLALVATDISAGKPVILREGNLAQAVMASACIPGVFQPVVIHDRALVDGGVIENVPISPLESLGAKVLVGSDLNANRKYKQPNDLIDVVINAIDIAIDHSSNVQASQADLIIAPNLNAYDRTDVSAVHELVKVGYETAQSRIADYFYLNLDLSLFESKTKISDENTLGSIELDEQEPDFPILESSENNAAKKP